MATTFAEAFADALVPNGLWRGGDVPAATEREREEGARISELVTEVLKRRPELLCSLGWTSVEIPIPDDKLQRTCRLFSPPPPY